MHALISFLYTCIYIILCKYIKIHILTLFQSAWHNAPQLLCFGDGQNVVPTIHIKDLAG